MTRKVRPLGPVRQPPKGSPFVKGDPRIDRRGGPGRRPKAYVRDFMEWCKAQLDTPKSQAKLAKRMWKLDRFGRSDPILSLIMQYAYGRPKATVELRTPDLSMLTREELEALVRIADRVGVGTPQPSGPRPLSLVAPARGDGQTTH